MLGALIGDTVGSVFEFNNIKTKQFPLISNMSFPTDDSIMTLAVADILQRGLIENKDAIIDTFKHWGRMYPNAGYGGKFIHWLMSEDRNPYNSCGNGSAMRISPVGWYARSEEEVKDWSRRVTEVTHNHPEGLKGAEVTAMCIYYARMGKSKEFIKKYVEQYYNLDFDYEKLRKTYYHCQEICQCTVPQAIFCFLISIDFEDCLRTTISIGGDCDTTSAISCAIAEAYYKKIDSHLKEKVINKFEIMSKKVNNEESLEVINNFLEYKKDVMVFQEDITNDTLFVGVLSTQSQWFHSTKAFILANYLLSIHKTLDEKELSTMANSCNDYDSLVKFINKCNEKLANKDIKIVFFTNYKDALLAKAENDIKNNKIDLKFEL